MEEYQEYPYQEYPWLKKGRPDWVHGFLIDQRDPVYLEHLKDERIRDLTNKMADELMEDFKIKHHKLERMKGFNLTDAFQPPPEGFIEHLEEHERESTEDYIEYCKYAQKLQTELSEASIFIQDEMNNIGLELAEIEERRIDLNALEVDLERQMAYLRTLQSITNKRKYELNREYEQTAKARGSSESETTGQVKMDKEHNNNQDG